MHEKKVRGLYNRLSAAQKTEEGRGGEDEEEAEQNCEGQQDVDQVGWER